MITKKSLMLVVTSATVLLGFGVGESRASFIAYDDLSYPTDPSSGNVTNFGLGGTTSGTLVDYATGTPTSATLTISGPFFTTDVGGVAATGGDAVGLFGAGVAPTLDVVGRQYGGAGSTTTFTFTGLAPGIYDFAMFIGDYPAGYHEKAVISDVTSFTNTSSAVVAQSTAGLTDDTSTYTGVGPDPNSVIRYSSINPDGDGDFTISLSSLDGGVVPYPIMSALRLEQATQIVPEPATFVLAGLGLLGLGFAAWRKKHCRASIAPAV